MSRPFDQDRNDRICKLRREGVGPREIARREKLSPGTVAGVLWRAGLTDCECGRGRGNGRSQTLRRKAVARAIADGTRTAAMAYGVSAVTIGRWKAELTGEGAGA